MKLHIWVSKYQELSFHYWNSSRSSIEGFLKIANFIPWLYTWGSCGIRTAFMSIGHWGSKHLLCINCQIHPEPYVGVFCQQKIIHGYEKLPLDWPLRNRNWNCIFGGSINQELGLVSELKTKTTKDWGKEYRSMKSIIYLTHLNSLIYSERLCSFRITIANTDNHCIINYLCRT